MTQTHLNVGQFASATTARARAVAAIDAAIGALNDVLHLPIYGEDVPEVEADMVEVRQTKLRLGRLSDKIRQAQRAMEEYHWENGMASRPTR